uniref:Uncharacterized protein n=1 Tax=Panagrolaimus superbus TaxID=310955 RepID=A0A914XWG2_9BILA
MAKMESELVALQGDTSIVEVNNNQRTTIGPNLKAIDLELVPKAPPKAIIGGPNTPIVTIGNDGEMFLLDVPSEKGKGHFFLSILSVYLSTLPNIFYPHYANL